LLPAPLRSRLSGAVDHVLTGAGYIRFDTSRYYAQDGLYSIHNQAFRQDPRFRAAYARGIQASCGVDQHLEWRVHVALWAAATALRTHGDFVECGVNAGFISSAIMRRLNWAAVSRHYYLVDTFTGPVLEQYSPAESSDGLRDLVK